MTYSKHTILPDGHIQVRQKTETGRFHRYVIAPNQSIDNDPEDVKQAIIADANYEKYRTQKNADAYEKRLKEIE